MSSNVHVLPIAKKPRRRTAAIDRPSAEVVQMADYCRPQAAVETPEQRVARLEKLLDDIAYHLVSTARLISSSRS